MQHVISRAGSAALLLLALGLAACNGTQPAAGPTLPGDDVGPADSPAIAAFGTDSTLDVGSWNLEWFGDEGNGPSDEGVQLDNVARVMGGLALDLWSVQEVTSPSRFGLLLDRLEGFDGFLADAPIVDRGADYYSDFGGNELKVGLVYRSAAVAVDSARVILTDRNYEFAGRPPVEVHLRTTAAGSPLELVVVLLHAKAGADPDDRDRRQAGAEALKAYLDGRYPARPVLVIGDFNDDVDTSIATGHPTPYAGFVADDGAYRFLTASISAAGISSTVFYPDVIDHQLASDELAALYVDGTATAFRPDADVIADYGESTSDHYPVLVRFHRP